jgi:hypothetical protein
VELVFGGEWSWAQAAVWFCYSCALNQKLTFIALKRWLLQSG